MPALKILTDPDNMFGYNVNDKIGHGQTALNLRHRDYPYLRKTFKNDTEASDPDNYRQFWMDFTDNKPSYWPTFTFSGNSAAFAIDGDLFSVTQHGLQSSLNRIANGLQQSMDHHSFLHKVAITTLPFYGVIYKSVTDAEYKLTPGDILSVVNDAIIVLAILISAGMSISSNVMASLSAKMAGYHMLGYSGRALIYKTLAELPRVMMTRAISSILINSVIDIIEPIPLRSMASVTRDGLMLLAEQSRISRYPESINTFVNVERRIDERWRVDVAPDSLTAAGNDERFNSVYVKKNPQAGSGSTNEGYIRHKNATYLVRWDEYARSWRIIDPANSSRLSYQMAVKLNSEGQWITHYPLHQSEPDIAEMINAEDDDAIAGPSGVEPGRSVEDNTGQFIQKFVPIIKRKITKNMVSSQQGDKFTAFFEGKKHVVFQGFDVEYERMKNTYLPEVIPVIKRGVEFSENIITKSLKRLSLAKKDPYVMKDIQAYFSGALGTDNEKIISEAIERMTLIAEESQNIVKYSREKNYKNLSISSSVRPSGSEPGTFSDTFTREMLLRKTVAFVFPGDEKNIISINGDMISLGIRDYADRSKYVGYTLLHETSHLAVATSDIKYLTTSRKNTDNAEKIKNFFDDMINNKNLNMPELDKFTDQVRQVNHRFGILNDDEVYHALKTDTILRSNLMLSNADSVTAYLIDIADERTFNTDLPRLLEPEIAPVVQNPEKVAPPLVNISRKRGPRSVPGEPPEFNFNILFLTLIISQVI